MNRQEVFNTVSRHLLTQMKQAKNEKGMCLYQTNDNLKCAVGILIPDGHPAQNVFIELTSLIMMYPDLKEILGIKNNLDLKFLTLLQVLHDTHLPVDWRKELKKEAERFELNYEVLDEFREEESPV